MSRKFCSSAVYSPTPHVLILTALTCGYNQVQFFTRTMRLYLRFPLSLPWNKNDPNNSPPRGPKGQACPMGFQGVDAEERGWLQVNWTMHLHDSFLLGDKETTALHSDYSFFGRHLKGMGASTWMTPKREKKEDLSPIRTHHICFSFPCTLPLQMAATQISVFGNTCVLSIPSLYSNHCYWYGKQNTNRASEQADWSFDLLT